MSPYMSTTQENIAPNKYQKKKPDRRIRIPLFLQKAAEVFEPQPKYAPEICIGMPGGGGEGPSLSYPDQDVHVVGVDESGLQRKPQDLANCIKLRPGYALIRAW